MKKTLLSIAILVSSLGISQTSQDSITGNIQQENIAHKILSGNISKGVTIGGYAQVDYNQPEGKNGNLDVHRVVILFGYKFNEKVQFISEIES